MCQSRAALLWVCRHLSNREGGDCQPFMYAIKPIPMSTTPSIDAYGKPACRWWSCTGPALCDVSGVIVLALDSVGSPSISPTTLVLPGGSLAVRGTGDTSDSAALRCSERLFRDRDRRLSSAATLLASSARSCTTISASVLRSASRSDSAASHRCLQDSSCSRMSRIWPSIVSLLSPEPHQLARRPRRQRPCRLRRSWVCPRAP